MRKLIPEGGGHETVCQQEHLTPKRVDWGIPHQLKKGMSANKDAGPKGGLIVRSLLV